MGDWVRAAAVADIPDGEMIGVRIGGRDIALYRSGDTFHATANICTHAYALLSNGWFNAEDCSVECPIHNARFDVATGAPLQGPALIGLAVYPVRRDGDALLIEIG